MSVTIGLALLALLAACGPQAVRAQNTANVVISVVFGANNIPVVPADRSIFAGSFRKGFAEAVNLANCDSSAIQVLGGTSVQTISYGNIGPTNAPGATITTAFPYTDAQAPGVGLVVANPADWFSMLDRTQTYTTLLIKYLDPSPPGGFYSSVSTPVLPYDSTRLAYVPCAASSK